MQLIVFTLGFYQILLLESLHQLVSLCFNGFTRNSCTYVRKEVQLMKASGRLTVVYSLASLFMFVGYWSLFTSQSLHALMDFHVTAVHMRQVYGVLIIQSSFLLSLFTCKSPHACTFKVYSQHNYINQAYNESTCVVRAKVRYVKQSKLTWSILLTHKRLQIELLCLTKRAYIHSQHPVMRHKS